MNPSWSLFINDEKLDSNCFSGTNMDSHVAEFLYEWNDSSSAYIKAKTSGSTGEPKEILLPKKSMIASAQVTNEVFQLHEDSDVFCPISAQFIAGKMMIVRSIVGGMHLHFVRPMADPSSFFNKKKYQFGVFTPHQINTIISNRNESKLESFDKILLGGGAVSQDLEHKLSQFSTQFFLGYGMTETMSHVALRPLGIIGNTYYKACPNIHFSTSDEDALIIHAPNLLETPLLTNDIVKLLDDRHFEWLGRKDFIINSGGIKLNPFKIEKKIEHLIPFPYYIVGIDDNTYGQRPCLYIESTEKIDKEQLHKKIRVCVHKYEIPNEIRVVPKFEHTKNGKIKRLSAI